MDYGDGDDGGCRSDLFVRYAMTGEYKKKERKPLNILIDWMLLANIEGNAYNCEIGFLVRPSACTSGIVFIIHI